MTGPGAMLVTCGCSWSRTRSGRRPRSKRGLEAEGYAVDVASNGTDGLWLASEQPYDAVVLDVMLPGSERLPGVRGAAGPRRSGRPC